MEKKLAEYRAKREREAQYNKYKTKVKTIFENYFKPKQKVEAGDTKEKLEPLLTQVQTLTENDDVQNIPNIDDETDASINCCTYVDLLYYLLWFILWATVYGIFIKLQFGTVYLLFSGLVGIYINTRTGPKQPNEVSAYSVFNKDCESIDGTLKAEQFENEIRYGSGAVR